jgi:hypothetical protein
MKHVNLLLLGLLIDCLESLSARLSELEKFETSCVCMTGWVAGWQAVTTGQLGDQLLIRTVD